MHFKLLLPSLTLYLLSLPFPAFNGDQYGFPLAFFGWMNFTYGGANFAWLANPALWLSWFFIKSKKKSLRFSLLATFFCLLFLLFEEVAGAGMCGSGFLDSYDCDEPLTELNAGYYLWVLSAIVMLFVNLQRKEDVMEEDSES
jgi:hypothetical protein